MAKGVRLARVVDSQRLTGSMQRLVLSGDFADYPVPHTAAHIKLFIPRAGQAEPQLPLIVDGRPQWSDPDSKPWVRTYTVRAFDARSGQMTIDLVLHDAPGPASDWARQASVGSVLGISMPGGPDPLLPVADYYWLAGDASALPAIAALLERLPASARGEIWIKVADGLRLPLNPPASMRLNWLPPQAGHNAQLLAAMQQASWPTEENFSIWIAAEHQEVLGVRQWLLQERQFRRQHLYAVPYWRQDLTEEAYHQQRHQVMDA